MSYRTIQLGIHSIMGQSSLNGVYKFMKRNLTSNDKTNEVQLQTLVVVSCLEIHTKI